MISVIILTKNEEADLPVCLESLEWTDDVHVLDSLSTDKTCEIALQYGANVLVNPFQSFGKQRNFALKNIDVKYDWVLFLDADEVASPEFVNEIQSATDNADDDVAGFYCCWKMMLEGRWLKRCDNFPKWQLRLLRKNRVTYTDFGHGQKEDKVLGNVLYIKEPYIHFGFSKGWSHWIERHNRYSTLEAIARLDKCPPLKNIFSKHGSIRNPALKSWLIKVPGWPLLRFIHTYIFKLGFIEGSPGLTYSINLSFYEHMIVIKRREILSGRKSNYNNVNQEVMINDNVQVGVNS
ncbi:Glycosyltransferase involved in cell wall bisynthesis [Mucilaginibacter mallensis]|uniref:Glycosyltransferase involved in cell wall bisynthesis n=1 Tax=Mucilaginibacter mallensis TaxID=652787 RepID=A0A1H1XA17_MUCMA|nr:glycosyltransferase family 2 protein [Mucilaginibacter mallensis]SDT06157.1 Glycosyltransferase involved in cell wall bisynthesis [Mucilaginibacter mallensis]